MGYISGVFQRLKKFLIFILVGFLTLWFPGGMIVMGVSCGSARLDAVDWVMSVLLPFFGIVRAISC